MTIEGSGSYSVSHVKDNLSAIVRRAEAGEIIRIAVNGRPAARLVADTSTVPAGTGGWTLVDSHLDDCLPHSFLPEGIRASATLSELGKYEQKHENRVGLRALLNTWQPSSAGGYGSAVCWQHLTAGAAVIAVPDHDWREAGCYFFFHTLGPAHPITALPAWGQTLDSWKGGDQEAHRAAHDQAESVGNRMLGLN